MSIKRESALETAEGLLAEARKANLAKDYSTELFSYNHAFGFLSYAAENEVEDPVEKQKIYSHLRVYQARAASVDAFLKAQAALPAAREKQRSAVLDGHGMELDADLARLALQETIVTAKPSVRLADVIGLEGAKDALMVNILGPLEFPHLFTGARKPIRAILLFGPPGTGKTHLAQAIAAEADFVTFFAISAASLMQKYIGDSEKTVKGLFDLAREKKPSIVFIDEIDSLCGGSKDDGNESESARRLKTELLCQMQGLLYLKPGLSGTKLISAADLPARPPCSIDFHPSNPCHQFPSLKVGLLWCNL